MTELKGSNGTISFDGQFVTISRKGLGARLLSGGRGAEKRIPLKSITAVQYKKSGMTVGYIQVSLSGESAHKGARTADLLQDENTVTFYAKQNDAFKALADEINAALVAGSAPAPAAPDIAEQISKLAALRDQGILTDEEFDAKKAELLSRL